VSLPTPNLDDLQFQRDLVDEARRRIVQYCPEWTDYNLSDPGITLIELFAWMTELMVYRLNRVPDKNYVKFMELLGVALQPASSATVDLTFRLSVPFPISQDTETIAVVPESTQVTTRPLEGEEEVIFSTDRTLTIHAPRLTQLRRRVDFAKNYLPRLNVQDFRVFRDQFPEEGDTFFMGFDASVPVSGYILRLDFSVLPTQATGIRRDDPPLVWECSVGNGEWYELTPSQRPYEQQTIGGLNNPTGQIVFYLPMEAQPAVLDGIEAYWLRCRFEQRRPSQGTYSRSPRVIGLEAKVLGASVSATHSVMIENEFLGMTAGEPGQIFQLASAPILEPRPNEVMEVEERVYGEFQFVPWSRVSDFSESARYDRHYILDSSTGEIMLGPTIRQRDGSTQQFGRVPDANRQVRFSRYRAGGGVAGNLPEGRLNMLRSTIPYIDSVVNLRRASGGRDQETLDEAKLRAPLELRAQQRAVTAADYEDLARQASRSVSRARCLTPGPNSLLPPGSVEVLIVPASEDALLVDDLSRLYLTEGLRRTVERHLDQYRMLTTNLIVREPAYIGIRAQMDVILEVGANSERVRRQILQQMRAFLSPLDLSPWVPELAESLGASWRGWPFGRHLSVSEIYALVQNVPGVRYVSECRLFQRPVKPIQELPVNVEETDPELITRLENSLRPVEKTLMLADDQLLCSLDHVIHFQTGNTATESSSNGERPGQRNVPLTVSNGARN
jgi:predicted phage baseplate assembly protein